MNGTSWLLGGSYPWHSGDPAANDGEPGRSSVVANPNLGLSLASLRDGPLGLSSEDGSLGRLVLPLGVAVDGAAVLVLSADGARVYRYNPIRVTLDVLPEVGADGLSPGSPDSAFAEPRRFRRAANIAAAAGVLYVADPEAHRVQVFDLQHLALLRIHGDLAEPVDVAATPRGVYILDRAAGRVYRTLPWSDSLQLLVDSPARRGVWSRIAMDREQRIYLLDRSTPEPALDMAVSSAALPAVPTERFIDGAQIRERFDTPPVAPDGHGGFDLSPGLADPCGLRPAPDPSLKQWSFGQRTYSLDSRLRELGVRLADGRWRHRFGPCDGEGKTVSPDSSDSWNPVDLTSLDGCVLILDERYQTVHAHTAGAETLRRRFAAPADHDLHWRRISQDQAGCLLLWDGVGDRVDRVDPRGDALGSVGIRDVRARFELSPPEARDFVPPPRLTRDGVVAIESEPSPRWPQPTYRTGGVWISRWLDSDLYNCQWHLIELSLGALPPGSRIRIKTRTSNEKQSDAEVQAALGGIALAGSWREAAAIAAPPQPGPGQDGPRRLDLLVPSEPGQYLQLLIELAGSGFSTPVIASLRARFPRESLLQYLPAIYSSPDAQRDFLDRFLEIMQTTWTGIERQLETFHRYLDPDSVPAEAMPYLAGWLDLQLEGTWTPEQNRRLLQAIPRLRARWGTPDAMRAWLRVYLGNLSGVDEDDLEKAGIPGLVENFVERRRLMLGREDLANLGAGGALWSPSVERRFQVGVFDREGEVELVSIGDPDDDLFRHYAHSFRVYVPAAWIRTPDDEALVRRAIELQKPAHCSYELVLVEPRLLIGQQSTLGLDTVIGAPVAGALVCPRIEDAPSRPPHQRLGFDTVLGCGNEHRARRGLVQSLA